MHLFGLIEEHFLLETLDEGVDIGGLGGVDFKEVKDSVLKVFDFEFGGLGVFGIGNRVDDGVGVLEVAFHNRLLGG